MSRRLLIAGVPGTGKTTVGNYLASEHGFHHLDMEADGFKLGREIHKAPMSFYCNHLMNRPTVMTWGFSPYQDGPVVEELVADHGFELVWLDGDRTESFRIFMQREGWQNDKMELAYHRQMAEIISTRIVERLKPRVVDPFYGGFRGVWDIAEEIMDGREGA